MECKGNPCFQNFHNTNHNIVLRTTTIFHSILHAQTNNTNTQQLCNYIDSRFTKQTIIDVL